MNTTAALDYDVIVFGGGPAGAAAALALVRKDLSVALVCKQGGIAPAIGETVPPGIVRPLAQLGLWETFLAATHASAPGTVVIWGEANPFENDFVFNPYGPAWHLDRPRFDAMLLAAAQAAGAYTTGTRVLDCARNSRGGWTVRATGDFTLSARWVVDATGRAAWLARRMGAKRQRVDGLVALLRFASVASISEPRTLIEACPQGWWYAAALPQNRVVAAFFTDTDLMPRDAQQRARHWDQMLAATQLIKTVVPASTTSSPIHIAAASTARVFPCAGDNWLSIGDAAQAYDPLSGQGIVKAINSALQAAEVISADLQHNRVTLDDFTNAIDREFERYSATRLAYYQREQRWAGHKFWHRRTVTPHASLLHKLTQPRSSSSP